MLYFMLWKTTGAQATATSHSPTVSRHWGRTLRTSAWLYPACADAHRNTCALPSQPVCSDHGTAIQLQVVQHNTTYDGDRHPPSVESDTGTVSRLFQLQG